MGVVVLTYGRDQEHLPLIEGLREAGVAPADILVVHNPYTEGDHWQPASRGGVAVLRMPVNGGYAAAMNAGIAALAPDHAAVCLLTHDTRLDTHALRRLHAALVSAPEYGVLGPAIAFRPGPPEKSFGGRSHADGTMEHLAHPPPLSRGGIGEVEWVDGCALIVRTAAFQAAGGLDERYFMYFEETDLCTRVRSAGWKVGVVPAAEATSASGVTRRPAVFGYLYARNGLDWSRRSGGHRRAARFAWHQAAAAWREAPKPGGRRFSDATLRQHGHALAAGRILGLLGMITGRWGPPPTWLTLGTDMTEPP